jgi:hypothetical protein|tara:strand:- start:344 stop:694 length:351 start_codon:yes stop_codon:yes gene_type:complete
MTDRELDENFEHDLYQVLTEYYGENWRNDWDSEEDGFYLRLRVWGNKPKPPVLSDEQRKKEFLDYLQKAPHVEFHSVNLYPVEKEWMAETTITEWDDTATMGLRVDFALTKAGEEG